MTTALYAGVFAFFYLALSVLVIRARMACKVGLGDDGQPRLVRAIRVHGNFIEYVPFVLLLMALSEIGGISALVLHATGLLLLAGRLAHAYGVSRVDEVLTFRQAGMMLTFTALGVAGTACLWSAFS